MAKVYHETLHPMGNLGIQISMATLENTHIPAHWHEAMEILFCLNGSVRINIENKSTSAMSSDGIVLLMLADLIQYFSVYSLSETTSGSTQSNDNLRKIISYVNEHYTEPLSLETVANHVGFSREYFCRFFKQHMGITFLRYLNEVRISHAGRLVSNTKLSISEIMTESGFTNQTLFNRLFKDIYGMTPRQARRNYPRKEPNLQSY